MPALEGTVNVPLAGKVSKKYAVGGLLVTATLVGVYYYRKRKSSATATTATAAAAADQYPPDGTTGNPSDPYSTDPATGQTYGDESLGSTGGYGAYGPGAASGLYYDPATGAYDLTSPYGTTPAGSTGGGPPFASNEAWSNWVIPQLQALNPNIDVGALTDALGLYLQGQQVTPAQKTLIFDALAIAGDPPVAGPGGYPPAVKTQPINNHTTVIVPKVTGERVENASSALEALGLKAAFGTRKPGVAYVVTGQSPAAGRRVNEGSTVQLTIAPKPPGPGSGGGGTGLPKRPTE